MENSPNASSFSSNSSEMSLLYNCFNATPSASIFTVFTVTNILLLLPLSIFILFLGFRRWQKQRRSEAWNPTDVFTYHMVGMEMIGITASITCSCGAITDQPLLLRVGCNMFAIISCIKMFFHILICVERYVAVVHPIAYLNLSKAGGVTIRNISIGIVWLICAGIITLRILINRDFIIILFFFNLVLSLLVSSFCSLAVLRVLVRAGPGDEVGKGGKDDRQKQKAFVTITAIMAVLLLRFGGNLVCLALTSSPLLSYRVGCVVRITGIWFCLPSSYVLPLLFLHRAQKLFCFKYKLESG